MAGEKIKIVELDINDKLLVKKASELKELIDELKEKQKELTKQGDTSSEQFVQNATDLKVLNSNYQKNIKVLAERTQVIADTESRQKLLTIALDAEVHSISEARSQNKILTDLRNDANITTKAGAEELEKLNAKIDANNELIKENADNYLQQKINVGNYKESIKEAFGELNIFNGGIGGFIERSKEAGGTGKLVKSSLKGMAQGLWGVTKASIAFIATPIGAILAVLIGAFLLVKNAMNRSEEATNKITKIFSAFGAIVNKLLKWLEPLGEFLIDGLVLGFELAGKAAEKAMNIISGGLRLLGFDSAANSISKFSTEMKIAIKEAQALADAEAKLEKQQRKSQLIQLQYQKDAEKLRQLRDDESKSIKERIKANEDLGAVLQKQLEEEMRIAELALVVANARIKAEGETKEALDAQSEALTTIADIQERITGQESEQLTNRNSLRKEANEQASAAADKRIEAMEQELAYLEEQNRFSEDNLATLKKIADEEVKILKEKLKSKKISQIEYNTEILRIENNLKEKKLENEQTEIERIQNFETKKKELQDAIRLKNEEDDLNRALLKADIDYQKNIAELENLQLNEQQKTELLALLTTEREQILKDIRTSFADKELDRFKQYSQKIIDTDKQKAQERINIAKSLTSILTGLLGDSIGAQLASIAIQAGVEAGIVKISTASSQAKNLAQATAVAPPPLNVPFISTAIAQNAIMAANSTKAITKILTSAALQGLSTIIPKRAEGGIIPILKAGKINNGANLAVPLSNGDDTLAYVGQEEVILNKEHQRKAGGAPFFKALGVPGFANSGLVGGATVQKSVISNTSVSTTKNLDVSGIKEAVYQGSKEGIKSVPLIVRPSEIMDMHNENQAVISEASR